MNENHSALVDLRREIDELDEALHGLLMKRAAVVSRIAAEKARVADAHPPIRPGREAEIIRRRLAAHHGPLPPAVIARIWREIIAGFTRIQGKVEVALFAPRKSASYWDLARSHFGGGTPIALHASAAVVIDAITAGDASVGVLPVPEANEEGPWWPQLVATGQHAPQIVARLPFVSEQAGGESLDALVVAAMDHEATSQDRSYVALGSPTEVSRTRILSAFRSAGLEARVLSRLPPKGKAAEWLDLLELDGYVRRADPRLNVALASDLGAGRAVVLGGYSVPLKV